MSSANFGLFVDYHQFYYSFTDQFIYFHLLFVKGLLNLNKILRKPHLHLRICFCSSKYGSRNACLKNQMLFIAHKNGSNANPAAK